MFQNPNTLERPDESIDSLRCSIVSYTQKSEKHPDNQDAMLVQRFPQGQILLGVFDGLGGHVSGEEASRTAANVIQKEAMKMPHTISEIQVWMQQALIQSNQVISKVNDERTGVRTEDSSDNLKKRMATTATIACIFENNLVVGHMGNSRCYIYENGALICITVDDNDFQRLYAGYHQDNFDMLTSLDDQSSVIEFLFQNRSLISKALGLRMDSSSNIYTKELSLERKPLILLTTDGIHHNLTTEEILAVIQDCEKNDPNSIAQRLVEVAKKRALVETEHIRSHDDDMTAVACWIS